MDIDHIYDQYSIFIMTHFSVNFSEEADYESEHEAEHEVEHKTAGCCS